MNPEIFNIYVEKLTNEVAELTKSRIILAAQLTFTERLNQQLSEKVNDLEKALDKANNKSSKKSADNSTF